jgi:hypothetical protein
MLEPGGGVAEVVLGRAVTWSEGRRHRRLLRGKDRLRENVGFGVGNRGLAR